jgi:hypothetical protein
MQGAFWHEGPQPGQPLLQKRVLALTFALKYWASSQQWSR